MEKRKNTVLEDHGVYVIGGKKGAGKTTLSKMLQVNYNVFGKSDYFIKNISFASSLKLETLEHIKNIVNVSLNLDMLNILKDTPLSSVLKEYYKDFDNVNTYRDMMVQLSIEKKEKCGKYYFTDLTRKNIENLYEKHGKKSIFVVDDCRFQMEIDMLNNLSIEKDIPLYSLYLENGEKNTSDSNIDLEHDPEFHTDFFKKSFMKILPAKQAWMMEYKNVSFQRFRDIVL